MTKEIKTWTCSPQLAFCNPEFHNFLGNDKHTLRWFWARSPHRGETLAVADVFVVEVDGNVEALTAAQQVVEPGTWRQAADWTGSDDTG